VQTTFDIPHDIARFEFLGFGLYVIDPSRLETPLGPHAGRSKGPLSAEVVLSRACPAFRSIGCTVARTGELAHFSERRQGQPATGRPLFRGHGLGPPITYEQSFAPSKALGLDCVSCATAGVERTCPESNMLIQHPGSFPEFLKRTIALGRNFGIRYGSIAEYCPWAFHEVSDHGVVPSCVTDRQGCSANRDWVLVGR